MRILYAVGAYVMWGVFPVYWKLLQHVPALQLLSHRIIWSFVSLILLILLLRQWKSFYCAVKQPKVLLVYLIAAIMITINWFVYIWAVNAGFIIEASLGYFISPLVSVLMGVLFLREKLRPAQWIAVGLAGAAVIYLIVFYGQALWIGLVLAFSFGSYGLIKKVAQLNAFYGLTLETATMFLVALIYLFYVEGTGNGILFHTNLTTDILLIGSGLVTTIPLLMFASAVRHADLSLVGFLQYICPTLQFLIGKFVYQEKFTSVQFIGFGVIWLALIIFILEGIVVYRKMFLHKL